MSRWRELLWPDDACVEISLDDASDAAEVRERIVCRTCRREVEPRTIAGVEAHNELACPGRDEIFAEHMLRVAEEARPEDALAGERLQIGKQNAAERLFSPTESFRGKRARSARATVRLESGRSETLLLALWPGGEGAPFRFLEKDEAAALDAALLKHDETDAERLRQKAEAERERAASADARAAAEASKSSAAESRARSLTSELEAIRLCDVCMDRPKDAACVPCGHLMCTKCAKRCQRASIGCPTCRRRIDSLLPIFTQ
ncbi:hypothetical protein SO694_00113074 [Aureococcus anophagefferens]|uniref:RING-type domain-containing protein n=1 Tax=Aureococcus anophagefferens TaxID=44056 RepID=A0ABR1FX56_AURAN